MDPAKIRIRFCVNNPRTIQERNDLVERDFACLGCLGNCDRCFETRFLEINNRFVEGGSYQEILESSSQEPSSDQP